MPEHRSIPATIRRLLSGLRALWLIIGSALLLLVALELLCSLWTPPLERALTPRLPPLAEKIPWGRDYFRELEAGRVRWSPYVYWCRLPFQGRYINVDSAGVRRTWRGRVDPGARPVRVVMFGGSTMWGTWARDEHTIPSEVARALEEHGVDAVVTNAGETGYVSTQEAIALLLRLRKGDVPDFAVFYDGANDLFSAWQSGRSGMPQNESNRAIEFNLLNPKEYGRLLTKFAGETIRLSHVFRFMQARFPRLEVRNPFRGSSVRESTGPPGAAGAGLRGAGPRDAGPSGVGPQEAAPRGADLAREVVECYAANTRLIESWERAYGFQPLFYWQPVVYTKEVMAPEESACAKDPWRDFFLVGYQALRADAAKLPASRFADLSDVFGGTSDPVFMDFCHTTEEGNRIVAERMAQDILRGLRR